MHDSHVTNRFCSTSTSLVQRKELRVPKPSHLHDGTRPHRVHICRYRAHRIKMPSTNRYIENQIEKLVPRLAFCSVWRVQCLLRCVACPVADQILLAHKGHKCRSHSGYVAAGIERGWMYMFRRQVNSLQSRLVSLGMFRSTCEKNTNPSTSQSICVRLHCSSKTWRPQLKSLMFHAPARGMFHAPPARGMFHAPARGMFHAPARGMCNATHAGFLSEKTADLRDPGSAIGAL